MLNNVKALVVILGCAWLAFRLCRPLCLKFMPADVFARRRKVWFALTIVAFLSPTFWIYALFALIVLGWAAARDENPLALYVMVTFTVPEVTFYIPMPLINQLFALTQYRILSLAIAVPAMVRIIKSAPAGVRGIRTTDLLLAVFLLLQVVLTMQYEAFTNTMRRTFLFGIDSFVILYAFSRVINRERVADVMASFWMACAVMAPIAVFESLRGWLLYTGLVSDWGDPNVFSYLLRAGALRAQAAAAHSINFGYHMALGIGMYLYLRTRGSSKPADLVVLLTMSAALLVSYARGPWMTAVLLALVFTLLRPNAARQLAGTLVLGVCLIGVMYATPLKERVLDRLPFIGSTDQNTVEYRQQLFETSWMLIQQNPFFGDPFVTLRMESLRQGQGIIDIVNGYIATALFSGFVGLGLVLVLFAVSLARGFGALLKARQVDADAGAMGASLVACTVGSLLYIATAGFGTTMYILCGLLSSFAALFAWHERSGTSAAPSPLRTQSRHAV